MNARPEPTVKESSAPPHRMDWTPGRIGSFWDWWSRREIAAEEYFAHQAGAAVGWLLSQVAPSAGVARATGSRVLDFGCGPGHLVPHLLATGALVHAADGSAAAVEAASGRFAGAPGWQGASLIDRATGRASFPDASLDVVCCLETIEHVRPDEAPALLAEIARLLAPGGRCLITTPNDEPLERSFVFCPECGSEFHKVQHQSRWTGASLRAAVEGAGLRVDYCQGIDILNLAPKQPVPPWHWSVAYIARRWRESLAAQLDRAFPRPFPQGRVLARRTVPGPNLIAVATKEAP